MYEGTVGAGLPVLSTLKQLIDTGDEVQRIEGVFRWVGGWAEAPRGSGAARVRCGACRDGQCIEGVPRRGRRCAHGAGLLVSGTWALPGRRGRGPGVAPQRDTLDASRAPAPSPALSRPAAARCRMSSTSCTRARPSARWCGGPSGAATPSPTRVKTCRVRSPACFARETISRAAVAPASSASHAPPCAAPATAALHPPPTAALHRWHPSPALRLPRTPGARHGRDAQGHQPGP